MKSSHKTVSRHGAFTMVELLVVIGIVALLAALFIPGFYRALELARRAKCKTNVKNIAGACIVYMNNPAMHRSSSICNGLPRVGDNSDENSAADDDLAADWETANPAALWLLVSYKLIGSDAFLCPSAALYRSNPAFIAPAPKDNGFTEDLKDQNGPSVGRQTLSYSYLSQVAFTDGNTDTLVRITSRVNPELRSSELAIIADSNPGTDGGNSFNHDREGQNVAFLDGHASWFTSPIIKGTKPLNDDDDADNIYSPDGGGNASGGTRGALNDAFLLP